MALDLSQIGGVTLMGNQQRNRRTPKQEFAQRFTPLVQDKTPPVNLDTRGIYSGGVAEGLQDFSEALESISDEEQRKRAIEAKAQLKVLTDKEDDNMAENLEQAKTARANNLESSDLSTDEGIEQYTLNETEIDLQFGGKMDGRINEHRYKSKFEVDALQQDALTTKRIETIKDERNTTRGTNKAAEIIASHPLGADPNTYLGELQEEIQIASGSLEAHKKAAIMHTAINFALRKRHNVLKDPATDPKLLEDFLKDPLTIKYMSQEFLTAVQVGNKEAIDRRFENSPEGQKARAEQDKQKLFDEDFMKFTGLDKGPEAVSKMSPEIFQMMAQLFYASRGKAFPLTTLSQGQGLFGPGGVPIANVPPKVELFSAPPESDVYQIGGTEGEGKDKDKGKGKGGVTKIKSAIPRINPSVLERDGSLTLQAVKHLNALAFQSIPKRTDIEGNEQGFTDAENDYMTDVSNKSVEIIKEKAKDGMTTIEANAAAELAIPDKPETYNWEKAGRNSYLNLYDEPDATLEFTAEGLSAFNDDMEGHIERALANLKNLKGEEDISPLDIRYATDLFSAVQKGWNTLAGTFSDEAVHEPTERARLNFALMARDFIRLFSLNPRFVVKEQILLEKIFSGPSIFTNTKQAQIAISEFGNELKNIVKSEFGKLRGIRTIKEKNTALDSLAILGRINRRMARFKAGSAGVMPVPGSSQAEQEKRLMSIQDADTLTHKQAVDLGLEDEDEEGDEPEAAPPEAAPPEAAPPEAAPEGGTVDETAAVLGVASSGASSWVRVLELEDFSVPALVEALSDVNLSDGARQDIRSALKAFKNFTIDELNEADIMGNK